LNREEKKDSGEMGQRGRTSLNLRKRKRDHSPTSPRKRKKYA